MGTRGQAQIAGLAIGAVLLLGVAPFLQVAPWRAGGFLLGRFISGLVVLAIGAAYLLITAYPAQVRRHSAKIALGAAVVTYLLTPSSTTQREFYAVAAQVVPVLFLALAVEQRAFEVRSDMDDPERGLITFPAVGLLLAGAESFRALLDRPEKASLQFVASGLVLGGVALFIGAVAGPRTPKQDR
jgi:predicted acyltransferase